jgi:hypothetical protein
LTVRGHLGGLSYDWNDGGSPARAGPACRSARASPATCTVDGKKPLRGMEGATTP